VSPGNIGVGEMTFDLAKLKIAPGTYGFRFQGCT